MKNDFLGYWDSLWRDIPIYVWEWVVCSFILGFVFFILWKGWGKGFRMSLGLLLVAYVVIIYCSTVIFRVSGSESGHDFMPFWSYKEILEGRDDLIAENLMNSLAFVPVGTLAGAVFKSMSWKKVLVVGMCLSVGIEVLQFVFRKGFSEVDDVMHNTVGCLIGYGVFRLIRRSWQCFVQV